MLLQKKNMTEGDIHIEFGPVQYIDETARFMDKVMTKVAEEFSAKASNPISIEEAFLLRDARLYTEFKEFCEMLLQESKRGFDEAGVWHGETIEQVSLKVFDWLRKDEIVMEKIKAGTEKVEEGMKLVDLEDKENIQIIIIKDKTKEADPTETFSYLVVYPPEEKNRQQIRRREISFPTAMCHTIAASALLDETFLARTIDRSYKKICPPREVKVGEYNYLMRLLKCPPISGEELEKVITKHGRTIGDKLVQAGLAIFDKVLGSKGEHIDPLSAFINQDYAVRYVLACHQGIGLVVNEKIILPSMVLDG